MGNRHPRKTSYHLFKKKVLKKKTTSRSCISIHARIVEKRFKRRQRYKNETFQYV